MLLLMINYVQIIITTSSPNSFVRNEARVDSAKHDGQRVFKDGFSQQSPYPISK